MNQILLSVLSCTRVLTPTTDNPCHALCSHRQSSPDLGVIGEDQEIRDPDPPACCSRRQDLRLDHLTGSLAIALYIHHPHPRPHYNALIFSFDPCRGHLPKYAAIPSLKGTLIDSRNGPRYIFLITPPTVSIACYHSTCIPPTDKFRFPNSNPSRSILCCRRERDNTPSTLLIG